MSPIRSPLEDTTNGYSTPTPSPPQATAKKGPVLRRKPHQDALHPQLDSSESYPSPHESIYEASIAPSSAENICWYDAKDWAIPTMTDVDPPPSWQSDDLLSHSSNDRPSWEDKVVDSSGNVVPASFLQESLSPKRHTPHKLYPITEQNSLATLRTGPSISTLKAQPSTTTIRPLSPGLNGKKRKSFSVSDLPPSPSPRPVTTTPSPPPSPQSFYTPMEPSQPPPLRIPTPPGLPTFNAPAASTYRLPPPTVRFRDRLRSPTAAEREWVMQTVGLPKGVVMRGEDGVLVRGKFTPIRSGHFPPQRQSHALFRVPTVRTSNESRRGATPPRPVALEQRRVQFRGPRTEPVGTMGEGGVEPTVIESGRRRDERGERLLRGFYWVVGCCGGCEELGLGKKNQDNGRQGVDGNGNRGETPLLAGGFNRTGQ